MQPRKTFLISNQNFPILFFNIWNLERLWFCLAWMTIFMDLSPRKNHCVVSLAQKHCVFICFFVFLIELPALLYKRYQLHKYIQIVIDN